jgi:hypothetical protein
MQEGDLSDPMHKAIIAIRIENFIAKPLQSQTGEPPIEIFYQLKKWVIKGRPTTVQSRASAGRG